MLKYADYQWYVLVESRSFRSFVFPAKKKLNNQGEFAGMSDSICPQVGSLSADRQEYAGMSGKNILAGGVNFPEWGAIKSEQQQKV